MSKHFGTTWWGQRWLRALSRIDYSNRLPRGSRYARNGMVEDLRIEANQIHADVRGSRPSPYHVHMVLPPFDKAKLTQFLDALVARPSVVMSLLNHQLEPVIEELADDAGLKLFPSAWSDLKMSCTCPDWAVPCKHLAAVIYQLSKEIDNSPFLLFNWHQVDLIHELKKRGLQIDRDTMRIPSFDELLSSSVVAKDSSEEVMQFDQLPFSSLLDLSEEMMDLLTVFPSFAGGAKDFSATYRTALRKIIKASRKIVTHERELPGAALSDFYLERDDQVQLHCRHANYFEAHAGQYWCPATDLIRLLHDIPLEEIEDYSDEIIALKALQTSALHLVAKGLIAPRITKDQAGQIHIHWVPALMNADVRGLLDALGHMLPEGGFLKSGDSAPTDIDASMFSTLFISSTMTMLSALIYDNIEKEPLLALFFTGHPQTFDGIGDTEIPTGIQKWISKYHLSTSVALPRLIVQEADNDGLFLSVDVIIKDAASGSVVDMPSFINDTHWAACRSSAFKSLGILQPYIPELANYLDNGGSEPIRYTTDQFADLLFEVIPVIQLLNVPVLLPKELQVIVRPKASVKIKRNPSKNHRSYLRLDQELSFDWTVAIGDHHLSTEEFNEMVDSAGRLLKYKKQYIRIEPNELNKLAKQLQKPAKMPSMRLLAAALSGTYQGAPVSISDETQARIQELLKQDDIALPVGLQAKLRPYQERGYSWLVKNAQLGFGSVLADDMGLGKTIQVITYMLKMLEDDNEKKVRFLVIAPTSLLTNWANEIKKFAPGLLVAVYHGTDRKTALDVQCHVLLTTYGIVRNDHEALSKTKWHTIVIDEAQHIKNASAGQSKAVKKMKSAHFIAMSGTPVENRLSELWSIFDYANKGLLSTAKGFEDNYAKPIERFNDIALAEELKQITAPFLMRRLKTDKSIIADLPDKIEVNSYASLLPAQAALYQGVLKEAMAAIHDISGSSDQKTLFKRQGLILQMILALKQVCNHPEQYLKTGLKSPDSSGKLNVLYEKLDTIITQREKVLIFTQYKEMGQLLVDILQERYSTDVLFYHGSLQRKKRAALIEQFQTQKNKSIFVLTIKSAGTGLNLTAAQHVVHYDLWWNPAVEAQATDRAYRIGQTANVMVHRLITKNTFEERINEMIQDKKNLADLTVSTGEKWIGELNNRELNDLFELA